MSKLIRLLAYIFGLLFVIIGSGSIIILLTEGIDLFATALAISSFSIFGGTMLLFKETSSYGVVAVVCSTLILNTPPLGMNVTPFIETFNFNLALSITCMLCLFFESKFTIKAWHIPTFWRRKMFKKKKKKPY